MEIKDIPVFKQLLEQVHQKAIGQPIAKRPIGEFEAISFKIEESLAAPGVGARSLKNYTYYLLEANYRKINPSLKTLNLLVQYVWEKEAPDGLWHEYRMAFRRTSPSLPFQFKQNKLYGLIFIVTLLSLVVFLAFFQTKKAELFAYTFTHSNLPLLEEDGWFLFPDSIDLSIWGNPKYGNSNYLTLETYPGDSFLDNRDFQPFVRNILAHKISCGTCCRIQLKMMDFRPSQRYQQAGLFLFHDLDPVPSIRFTAADGGTTAIERNGIYSNSHLMVTKSHKERSKLPKVNGVVQLDSIILDILIDGNQFFFSHKVNDGNMISIRSLKLPYAAPKYIGLAAFQGRPEIPHPVYPQADTIPAHFAYVKVTPCEK